MTPTAVATDGVAPDGPAPSPRPSLLWLLLPAALGVVGILRHEWWRDEATTWLIVRSSNTLGELIANVGVNGHPKAYYVAAWALYQVAPSLMVFSLVNLALVIGAMAFFYRSAPFTPLQTVLFSVGFFPLYQYGVIARSYGLLLFLLFAYCHLRVTRPDAVLWRLVVLAALAQIHLFGITAAAAFVAFELWETIRAGRLGRRFYVGAAAVLVAGAVVLLQTFPVETVIGRVYLANVFRISSSFANGFVPNFGSFRYDSQVQRLLGIALGLGSILLLLRRPRALALYGLLGGPLLAVVAFVFAGFRWHHGFFFVFLLTALWVAREAPLRGLSSRFLTLVLTVHVAIGAYALQQDFLRPYSNGDLAANLLRDRNLDGLPMIGITVDNWPPGSDIRFRWNIDQLQPILLKLPSSRAYDPVSHTYERFWRHYLIPGHFVDMSGAKLHQSIAETAARLGKPFLLIELGTPHLVESAQLRLISDLPPALEAEHYRIFLHSADSTATSVTKSPAR